MDPYEGNAIDWDAAARDPKLKGVLHRAAVGLRTDSAFVDRAAEAHKRGLLWGAYLLGRTGSVEAQADLLMALAKKTDAQALALDVEDVGKPNMTLDEAGIFVQRVHDKTGRYPALYLNWSVYEAIQQHYDGTSVFAKTPLWIARFRGQIPPIQGKVWQTYALWQFASELNCPAAVLAQHKPALCEAYRPYRIPGTAFDMDIDVFNGDAAALKTFFGG